MLGPRVAVAVGTVIVAVTGGGVALAANQGGSHNSKPATHATSRQYSAGSMQRQQGKGNCPNMGGSSPSNTSAQL
jgi:hypothetical protein